MKKLIFFFVFLISFTSVQSQCNSNPYLVSGWGGTLYCQTVHLLVLVLQQIILYLTYGILEMVLFQINKILVILMEIFQLFQIHAM